MIDMEQIARRVAVAACSPVPMPAAKSGKAIVCVKAIETQTVNAVGKRGET